MSAAHWTAIVAEFLGRLLLAVIVGLAIKLGVAAFDHWIAWWAAALIAAVVVFGGFLLLDDDWDWWR